MKKYILALMALIIAGLTWYLFIKPYDYLVRFKASTYPGVINQALKAWSKSIDNSEISFSENLNILNQTIKIGDDTYQYEWQIAPISDTTSLVKVYATDPKNSLDNKIKIPFTTTTIEKKVKENILHFHNYLTDHSKEFRVRSVTAEKLSSKYVVYIPIKTTQTKKVAGMMKNYPLLDNLVASTTIKTDGMPFIEVTRWDLKNDSIYYNFCYPIIKQEDLPILEGMYYKEFLGGDMLKTEYNGNYITSDRAWYRLITYAELNGISIKKLPVEIFYSNPNFGGDELSWKAEIFMPINE